MFTESVPTSGSESVGPPRRARGISVSARITLPLLLPVLGVLLLSGILLTHRLTTVRAMEGVGKVTELVTGASALVHELQRERGASGGFLASKGTELRDDLAEQLPRTDVRLAAFETGLRQIGVARAVPAGGRLAGKLNAARDALATIAEVRRKVSQLAISAADSFAYYTIANTSLLDMIGEAAAETEAPEVAKSIATYLDFLQAKELAGQERAVGTVGFAAGRFDTARLRRLITLGDQQEVYFHIIAIAATPAQSAFMRRTLTGDAVDTFTNMRRIAADGGLEGHLDGITGMAWFAAATVRVELLKQIEDRLASDLQSLAGGIRDAAWSAFNGFLGGIFVLLTLTAAVAAVMIRAIVRPLGTHILTMQRLAAGETGLVISGVGRRDELGSMARAIVVFRDQAQENQLLTASQAAEQRRAQDEKAAALRNMAEMIETETTRALAYVSDCTVSMTATAGRMSDSAGRTGLSAQSAATAAARTLSNAQTVASAAEQLSASIREINSQMSLSTAVVGRALTAGSETRATITELDSKVARIGIVADMIRDIAARTNLLALNATIEAARAGEAGKGFAVVASEVKALAMQTARSTEEINRNLAEVRTATCASVDAVGRTGETIMEIDNIATSIAAAVEQQGAATAEIARNVMQIAQAADEMTRRVSEVSAEAEENGHQAGHVRDGAVVLATSVSELKDTVMRVVRTSTTEVDRRLVPRHTVSLGARMMMPDGEIHSCRIVDLSEHGARVQGAPDLAIGARGTVDIDGEAERLPFSVMNKKDGALGMNFDHNVASAAAIKLILRHASLRAA